LEDVEEDGPELISFAPPEEPTLPTTPPAASPETTEEPDTDEFLAGEDGVLLDLKLPQELEELVPRRAPADVAPSEACPSVRRLPEVLRLESDVHSEPDAALAQVSVVPTPEDRAPARDVPEPPNALSFAEPAAAKAAEAAMAETSLHRTVERLGEKVARLETELTDLRLGKHVRGQQVAGGFRFCLGFVLGLGILSGAVLGGMFLVGKLFHPPTLELLQRILRSLIGAG